MVARDGSPSLNDGDQFTGTVFTDNGGTASGTFFKPVDAVSFVFMHDSIMNEYVTGGDLTANSEWVVTFPTKNEYVNDVAARAPFLSTWGQNSTTMRWEACEPVLLDTVWDQEEQVTTIEGPPPEVCPPVVSPAPPPEACGDPDTPFEICFETNVLRFGEAGVDGALLPGATEILGSSTYTNIDNVVLGHEAGWARIDLMQYAGTNGAGVFDGSRDTRNPLGYDGDLSSGSLQWGLPVTGFWVMEANNGFLSDGNGGNVLANYGGLWNHKATHCFAGISCRESSAPGSN
jgi:hypothetical protein